MSTRLPSTDKRGSLSQMHAAKQSQMLAHKLISIPALRATQTDQVRSAGQRDNGGDFAGEVVLARAYDGMSELDQKPFLNFMGWVGDGLHDTTAAKSCQ